LLTVLQKAKIMLPGTDGDSSSGADDFLPETKQNPLDLLQSYFSDVIKYKITPTNRVYDQIGRCESYQLASIFINLNVNELSHLEPRKITVIEEVSNQIISSFPHKTLCLIHDNRINYLFCFEKKRNRTEQDEIIFNLLNSLMTNLKKILNYYLLAGISLSFARLQELGEMYDQAYSASKNAFFADPHIVLYSPVSSYKSMSNVTLDKVKLRALLQAKQRVEIETYINDLRMEIKELKDIQLFKAAFNQILVQFSLYADENKDSDQLSSLSSSLLKQDNFEKLYDFAAVKMHILNTLSFLLGENDNDDSSQMSHIIQKSISYIEQNYNKNISLSNLASNVEVSRNYLSFLFKQELGLNFSYYLTETRIKKAKKILEETNKKIYEVAELVGFDSPYYFSKVFKETTGKTCSEYRNDNYVQESS
jgi:two-component system response regulator YesN|nr:helix-turn-helix domain-containing protein [Spirochaetaceae bacterium]